MVCVISRINSRFFFKKADNIHILEEESFKLIKIFVDICDNLFQYNQLPSKYFPKYSINYA
jgi:hypothetical protein